MPDAPAPATHEIPPGMLCTTTWGMLTDVTTQSLLDIRGYNVAQGLNNIHYTMVSGALVDKARNEAARMLVTHPHWQYLIFLDADMWAPQETVAQLLRTAFIDLPWADAVGAYCQLRGSPYLPTIDTGSGTWESHDAGMGPIEVIRTGSACILVKRHVYERLEYPWYGVRPAPRPLDMLAEVDNFARCKMDGQNPLRASPAWDALETCARQDANAQRFNPAVQGPGGFFSSVGEDSSMADKMKAAGMRIVVDTNIVVQHLERNLISPAQHSKAMREMETLTRRAAGILV